MARKTTKKKRTTKRKARKATKRRPSTRKASRKPAAKHPMDVALAVLKRNPNATYKDVMAAGERQGVKMNAPIIMRHARDKLGIAQPKPARRPRKKSTRKRRAKAASGDNVSVAVSLHESGKIDLSTATYADLVAVAKKNGAKLPERGGRILGSARERLGLATPSGKKARKEAGRKKITRKARGRRPIVRVGSELGENRVEEARAWMQREATQAMNAGDFARAELALVILRRLG